MCWSLLLELLSFFVAFFVECSEQLSLLSVCCVPVWRFLSPCDVTESAFLPFLFLSFCLLLGVSGSVLSLVTRAVFLCSYIHACVCFCSPSVYKFIEPSSAHALGTRRLVAVKSCVSSPSSCLLAGSEQKGKDRNYTDNIYTMSHSKAAVTNYWGSTLCCSDAHRHTDSDPQADKPLRGEKFLMIF